MQVNHILKKSGIQPSKPSPVQVEPQRNAVKQIAMRKVKEATIKHLKSAGVHVPPENVEDLQDRYVNCDLNEVSFAVQQLLMKYLPNDQLAKVTSHNNNHQKQRHTVYF
ncbi:hypothetical protein FQA39_LY07425 [Lamprigera yunnana]|nr:hypothetical protein FQA39_LY07425 [Lamprigera yunnana]